MASGGQAFLGKLTWPGGLRYIALEEKSIGLSHPWVTQILLTPSSGTWMLLMQMSFSDGDPSGHHSWFRQSRQAVLSHFIDLCSLEFGAIGTDQNSALGCYKRGGLSTSGFPHAKKQNWTVFLGTHNPLKHIAAAASIPSVWNMLCR